MLRKIFNPFFKFARSVHSEHVTKVGILGVPFDKGQTKVGVADGPKFIREAKLIEQISEISNTIDIKDYGDVIYEVDLHLPDPIHNMKQYEHVISCTKIVSNKVNDIINDGRICLTLGGDHSIGLGTIDGHIRAKSGNVAVLWVDAHADLNTNLTSTSGNMHGMPLGILAKELEDYWQHLPGLDWLKQKISLQSIAYVGLRSVDPYEHLIIQNTGMAAFNMHDVEKHGIDAIIGMALDKIDPHQNKSIHVSFDIDSLDSLEAPSTGTSVRGGLLLREGMHIMSLIHKTGRLGAMDIVEVNPSIGTETEVNTTVDAAIHVALSAFGNNARMLSPKELPRPKIK